MCQSKLTFNVKKYLFNHLLPNNFKLMELIEKEFETSYPLWNQKCFEPHKEGFTFKKAFSDRIQGVDKVAVCYLSPNKKWLAVLVANESERIYTLTYIEALNEDEERFQREVKIHRDIINKFREAIKKL